LEKLRSVLLCLFMMRLPVLHCLQGLQKAKPFKPFNFFNWDTFDIEEYEHFEQVEVRTMLWICIYARLIDTEGSGQATARVL
jgi:hypothetical protein